MNPRYSCQTSPLCQIVNFWRATDSPSKTFGDTVELSLGGEAISRLVDGRYAYPIVLRLKEANRRSLQDLENLYIRKHNGKLIRLGDVAAGAADDDL